MACWRSEWIDENRRETEKKSEETLLERQFFFLKFFFHMFFHVFSYWLNERVKQTMGWGRGRGHEKTDHPVSRCWQVEIFQCLRGGFGWVCVCDHMYIYIWYTRVYTIIYIHAHTRTHTCRLNVAHSGFTQQDWARRYWSAWSSCPAWRERPASRLMFSARTSGPWGF